MTGTVATTLNDKDKDFIMEWREFLHGPFNDVMSGGYEITEDYYDIESGYEEHKKIYIDPENARQRLKERLDILKSLYDEYIWVVTDDKISTIAQQLKLLPEIDTPKARRIFARAIDKGYIEMDGDKLLWRGYGDGPKAGKEPQFYHVCKHIYGEDQMPSAALKKQFSNIKNQISSIKRDYNNSTKSRWKIVMDALFD